MVIVEENNTIYIIYILFFLTLAGNSYSIYVNGSPYTWSA